MMSTFENTSTQVFVVCLFFVASVICANQNHSRSVKEHPAAYIHRDLNKQSILECVVFELESIAEPKIQNIKTPHNLICSTGNYGPTLLLTGDYSRFFNDTFSSGVTSLRIPTGIVSADLKVDLDIPLSSKLISFSNAAGNEGDLQRRQMSQRKVSRASYHGFFKVLVVRVSDKSGHSPSYNSSEISNHVFSDDMSMASRYRACSNGQLRFTPAFGGTDIEGGVVDVVVDVDLSKTNGSIECVNAADHALSSNYDVGTSHTYTMYICPAVVDFGIAAGSAMVGGKISWYKDTLGSSPFVQMHEIGHNLRFSHSGKGNELFGDPTCLMGAKYKEDLDWGRMCFNAVKTWQTGWYSDKHAEVSPTTKSYSGDIVDINSISVGQTQNKGDVVVKIEDENEEKLYIMLHRLEGITSDMIDPYKDTHANRVNIIRSSTVNSFLIGSLASGEEYSQDNWSNTGQTLHIKVCSIAKRSKDGGTKVLVFLGSDQNISCRDDICQDSELKIKVNSVKRNCAWIANGAAYRCRKPGVASHCPHTCAEPSLCTADSEKKFQLKETSGFQGCSWVARKYTKQRCQMQGVASSCRATCEPFQ